MRMITVLVLLAALFLIPCLPAGRHRSPGSAELRCEGRRDGGTEGAGPARRRRPPPRRGRPFRPSRPPARPPARSGPERPESPGRLSGIH
ncbi:uncharacterized protein LOC113986144 [Pipra filicauda]|uniref:Uncharacterized protein LOC113986144 n=1 Tax=Pipra filicauda TaxID=649802 RepID=A0A7R5KKP7_9PASS|nr:uncharacterized protein LOC113986144 [Pipra filicauda]